MIKYNESLLEKFSIRYLSGKNEQNLHLHCHDFHELVFIVDGSVAYQIPSGVFKLKPGDMVFIRAYEKHGPHLLNPNTLYERITLQIKQKTLDDLSRGGIDFSVCFKQSTLEIYRFPYYVQSQIRMLLGKILTVYQEHPFGYEVLSDIYLSELFVKIAELFYDENSTAPTARLQPIQLLNMIEQYIIENIDSPISINDIANYVCMNKYSVMRFFKDLTGSTAYQYIINKRLEIAENLIRSGVTFSSAAEQCGFSDYSCFYRCFLKKYHVSPQKYFADLKDKQYR
ncbi:helix-turn-helix domain-containing protein [Clostridiales bacterium BX7]|uniref:Helix-turn-helix domain-containing protein n=1 Tax=Feifania hominis TaxID=2763660 RepID=A0A926HTR0_9FIRM|nr:helix-turn-helix domain-containing protein [Feifania hominis]